MLTHKLTQQEESDLTRFFIAIRSAMISCGIDSFSANCESGNDYVRLKNGTEVDGYITKSENAMQFLAGAEKPAQKLPEREI